MCRDLTRRKCCSSHYYRGELILRGTKVAILKKRIDGALFLTLVNIMLIRHSGERICIMRDAGVSAHGTLQTGDASGAANDVSEALHRRRYGMEDMQEVAEEV